MTLARLVDRVRDAHRSERGMTLVELMVSVAMMVIVMTIFTTVLLSIQQAVIRQQARSEMSDQARLALQQMDREIRSGNYIYNPSSAGETGTCGGKDCVAGYTVRVFTQVNAPTRSPSQQCVQWVIDDRQLFRRAWEPGESTSLGGWRMVADGIVNYDLSPKVPAFLLDATGRVLDITMMVNSKLGAPQAPRTVRMNTSIAIRNPATAGPCDPIPVT